jgi:hypothetical protein
MARPTKGYLHCRSTCAFARFAGISTSGKRGAGIDLAKIEFVTIGTLEAEDTMLE